MPSGPTGAHTAHVAHAGATRLTDWPRRLSAFIGARRRTPFAWGIHDCCTFAADWVGQARGVTPFPDLRAHRTAFAATRALVRAGARDAAGIATLALGPPLGAPAFAGRGDICAIDFERGRPTLGICLGGTVAVAGRDGLEFVPLAAAGAAWRV